MKTYIKIFILFFILFSLFTFFFLFTLYSNKEYVKTNVEKDKAEVIMSLINSIKEVKQASSFNIKDKYYKFIIKKDTELIKYEVSVINVTDSKKQLTNNLLEIISFFNKKKQKKIYFKKTKNGSLYAKPIYLTKKNRYNIEYNNNDLIGLITVKIPKNTIESYTNSSFLKVVFYTIMFFIIIVFVIFILLKRLLKKENEFTLKLQEEVRDKTKELNTSNKELIDINVELIKLNKDYLVQNEELYLNKEQLKQKVEELTFTKEELEKRNKIILKREEELIKSQKELIDFNEAYQKQNEEYSLLIKKYIELNDNLQKQNIALEIAEYKAKEANEFKSQFLANMSHEIRTPMNAILGFSEILKTRINEEDNKKYISNIITSGNVLINLINDILDLSKIEAGELKIIKENINLFDTINKVPSFFLDLSKKKKVPVNVNFGKDVPQNVLIDGLRLNQILTNLVGNALKFTEKGNVCINVYTTKIHKNIADISIEVCDTGIGIPTEQLYSIFDTFKQVEGQSTRKYGGTGLGLSITKRLVRLLGGKIHVKSKVREGTTFSILFKDVEILKEIKEKESNKLNVKIKEQVKILHAEDNDMNREIISLFAKKYNFEIVEAFNGNEVIKILRTYKPDIILMDIQMPELDGYEAAKIIRRNEMTKNIPIIALTANATNEDINKYGHIFDGYITKPVSKDEFIKTISKFIKKNN